MRLINFVARAQVLAPHLRLRTAIASSDTLPLDALAPPSLCVAGLSPEVVDRVSWHLTCMMQRREAWPAARDPEESRY